jgi:hypothetical protein
MYRKGKGAENNMRENVIEGYLRDQVKAIGGKAYKFVSPGNAGVPDRLICLPGDKYVFVETKATGKKSTPLQIKQQNDFMKRGSRVFADIDSKEKVDQIITVCKGLIKA